MMDGMLVDLGDLVMVKNISLPKGTYVKLQPHSKEFLDVSNPRAMLVCWLYLCLFLFIVSYFEVLHEHIST